MGRRNTRVCVCVCARACVCVCVNRMHRGVSRMQNARGQTHVYKRMNKERIKEDDVRDEARGPFHPVPQHLASICPLAAGQVLKSRDGIFCY